MPLLGFNDDQLFSTLNAVLPCWLLLMLAPTSRATHALCLLVSFYICCLYAGLTLPMFFKGDADMKQFFTLDGVASLFRDRTAVLLGWAHYAVFDLWTGKWIAEDAYKRRMPRILVAPILFFTMMFGPCGLGTYFIARSPFKPSARVKAE